MPTPAVSVADFPANLRAARTGRRLSQASLAAAVGIDTRTVIRWEQGACLPSVLFVTWSAQALGVDATALMFDDASKFAEKLAELLKPRP